MYHSVLNTTELNSAHSARGLGTLAKKALDLPTQLLIADIMHKHGLAHNPSAVLGILEEELPFEDVPALRTIGKYTHLIRQGKLTKFQDRRPFEYPTHMGNGDDEIPWELARYALDGLGLYLKRFKERPSIGLVRHFAQVKIATQDTMDDWQIAIHAEQLWFASLIEDIPTRERPLTTHLEINLALKGWQNPKLLEEISKSLGASRLNMHASDFGFLRFMPFFQENFKNSPYYNKPRQEKREEIFKEEIGS